MRVATLPWLACPAPGCSGRLSVGNGVPPRYQEAGETELLEGILVCGSCGAEYPVILGAAILVPEQHRYLWAFWNDIERCATEIAGAEISITIRAYLGIPGVHIGRAEPDDPWDQSLDWTTSPYIQAHFDTGSLTSDLPQGWWQDAVGRFGAESVDPYTYLVATARGMTGPARGLAVEVGTGVGRITADLAADYRFCIGVDWSFRAVLTARRLLLSQPSPMEAYPLEGERGQSVDHTLRPLRSSGNLDYVVADGAALPFPNGGASCVAALNVLCAATEPRRLIDEIRRVAAPGGLLLLSSPYWPDSEPGFQKSPLALGDPHEMRAALEPSFEILAEREMVPWMLRLAKRRWNVYLCHCLVAARR